MNLRSLRNGLIDFSWVMFVPRLKPFVLSVLLLLPSIYWMWIDRSVWSWDSAWYGEVSVELWHTLTGQPGEWIPTMLSAFGSKAPGIAWFGQFLVPAGQLLGSIEQGLMILIIAAQVGTLTLVFRIGESFSPKSRIALALPLVVVAGMPLFIGMSQNYLTEALQLFAITYVYLVAVRAPIWPGLRTIGHLLIALSLAMAFKVTSPLYCAFPAALAVYFAAKRLSIEEPKREQGRGDIAVVAAGLVLFGATTAWYVNNLDRLMSFIQLASLSDVALDYGSQGSIFEKLQYWVVAARENLLPVPVLVILSLAAIAGSITRLRRYGRDKVVKEVDFVAIAALLQVFGFLLVSSLQVNEASRLLLPLAISVAVATMWTIAPLTKLFLGLFLLVAASQWAFVHLSGIGLAGTKPSGWGWMNEPDRTGLLKAEVERIVDMTCTGQTAGKYHMVGMELPWLNYNTLSFYSSKSQQTDGFRCYYTYLGHAERDVRKAYDRLDYYKVNSFISQDEAVQPAPADFLNRVSIPVLRLVKQDVRFTQVPFESPSGVVLFVNRESLLNESLRYRVLFPLTEQLRARFDVNYETIVVKGLDGIWLHPLPPEMNQPTAIAINIMDVAIPGDNDPIYGVEALASIENDRSQPITFRIELWSGPDGSGTRLCQIERTIRPADGSITLRLLSDHPIQNEESVVLSTEMVKDSTTNAVAHARFSALRTTTKDEPTLDCGIGR